MAFGMYEASVPVFRLQLQALSGVLNKGAAFAAEQKIDAGVLLQTRLYPNMFPLVRQVQIATDQAKGACARLAAVEPPSFPDTETTFDEVQARIGRTVDFLATLKVEQIDGGEDRIVSVPVARQPTDFRAQTYLFQFALPQFLFHTTTAYAILRHVGVAVGKRDFLGQFSFK